MFNINEVFEIAEQIERNGYAFYQKAAQIATNDKNRDFLNHLAEMEQGHENVFINIKKDLNLEIPIDLNDLDGVALAYLQAIVEGKIFINLQPNNTLLTGNETMEEIKKIALDFEKNTVLYFTALMNASNENGYKDKIQMLINEELQHILILTDWEV